jgi:predicted RNase H-like nuclease
MMSNKEYMLIWEWFRDTIYGVEKEEGVLVKTLAYYCVANEVFEDMYEAFTFFNLMTLSMDNLVLSFTELINVVTNPSIEQSNKLRLHIRSKKRRNEKKVKTVKTPSDKEPEKVVVEMEKSCFLPNFTHKRPSNAAITQNSDKGGCIDSGTSKDNPTANTNFLPQISSSRKSNQTETHANSEGIYRHALNPKHASDSSLHPAGRLHTIGRVFRRQLSRMASRDVDTSNGDEVASESATQTSEEDNLCIKKEKKQTKKQAKKQTKKQTKKETKNKDIQRQSSLQFF